MKYILPIIAAFLIISCKTTDVIQYEYKATTMLGSRILTVTQDSVISSFSGRTKATRTARATTSEEWTELKASVANLKLETISDLESPTNRRATDASPYGSVKLTTKDSTYHSSAFDGYNAHKTLLPLTAVMEKIAAKI
ncbi:MAG: hypothetical protein GQ574_12175 [Crocinitomix sp.]|nr:hypothetical protein [Crocinitomix sp.]